MIERFVERLIFACRWLLVPLYLGLAALLIVFGVKAAQELAKLFLVIAEISKKDLIVAVLSLVDLVLVANLLVMVILIGYETFVSRLDVEDEAERPTWLGKVDASMVKIKVVMSVVAISTIHLLEVFINIEMYTQEQLLWLAVIQLVFVVTAVLLGYLDKMAFAHEREH